ncbi:MAG: SDR family NAD(P)-dependent oxidoreductase [Steroidobacteraceae bacterium]
MRIPDQNAEAGLLPDRVALITGASSGIGRGVAEAMAASGAAVVINHPGAVTAAAAEEVVEGIRGRGGRAVAIAADVSDEHEAGALFEATMAEFSKIDILVNNAGIAIASPLHQMSAADFDRVLAVHLRGTFLMSRAVLPQMLTRGSGRIINTASQLAYKGAPGFSAYTAAKGAILSLTRSLALEVGPGEVTVNCVAPGATRTPMLEDVPAEILEQIRLSIPLGRLAEVADIVPSYLFLASEQGRHYQGQCLSPNGGDVFL